MARILDLLSYYPPYLQEYNQFQELVTTQEYTLNIANIEIDKLLENQFITTCDETGIVYFENLLNCYPSTGDSLSTRILRVLLKWNDFPPYTKPYLISVLNNLFGEENYNFIEDFTNYNCKIKFINNFLPTEIEVLTEFITNIKPANLQFDIIAKNDNELEIYTGFALKSNYKKSQYYFDSYDKNVDVLINYNLKSNYKKSQYYFDSYDKNIDVLINSNLRSNYIKEVINIE